jgi:hypothetical protein
MAKPNTIETCPKCGGVAKPIAVETEVGKVVISFRCPYCQTEWKKIRPEEREHPRA